MSSARSARLKRPGTTAEEVFARLVEAILSGEFPGGARLREAQLARQWKVSRTPMREAVRRAAEAGFAVLRPNQAPLIRSLTANDIHDLYDLRELLELRALELAWPQLDATPTRPLEDRAAAARPGKSRQWPRRCLELDRELHSCWMKHCGNSWLTADLEWLYQFLRIIQSWIGRDHQALADAYAEHLAVLHAIKRRDKTAARNRLRTHIRHSARAVTQTLARRDQQPGDGSARVSLLRGAPERRYGAAVADPAARPTAGLPDRRETFRSPVVRGRACPPKPWRRWKTGAQQRHHSRTTS